MRQLTKEDWMKILLVAVIAILVISYFWDAIVSLLFPKKPMVTWVMIVEDREGNVVYKRELSTVGYPLATVKVHGKVLTPGTKKNDPYKVRFRPKIYISYTTNYPKDTVVKIYVTRHPYKFNSKGRWIDSTARSPPSPYKRSPPTDKGTSFEHSFECPEVDAEITYDDVIWNLMEGEKDTVTIKVTATAELWIRGQKVQTKTASATLTVTCEVVPDPVHGSITQFSVEIVEQVVTA